MTQPNDINDIRLNCELVGDLLPLYQDGVLSDSGKQAVEAHLAACPACQREYERLCKPVAGGQETGSTGQKFLSMTRHLRWKHIACTVTAVVLACGLLIGGGILLTDTPLRELTPEEMTVKRAWRYTGQDGIERMFVLAELPHLDYYRLSLTPGEKEGTLELSCKYPLVGATHPDMGTQWEIICPDIPEDTAAAEFQGTPFWTEEDGEKPVPDYVYAFDSVQDGDFSVFLSPEGQYLGVQEAGHAWKYWDLDGNPCTPPEPEDPESQG